MKITTSIPSSMPKTALTIGSFDGVHLGHQGLLAALKSKGDHTTVLTFSNHPLQILKPQSSLGFLCTLHQKLALLKDCGVDSVIIIPFSEEFASTPFDSFLSRFSLSHLVLGEGSAFGKNREGNAENVQAFAEKQQFIAEFLPKVELDGEPISSRRIRAAVATGDFTLANRLLGRTYSVFFPEGKKQTTEPNLCLPPNGRYFVKANQNPVLLEVKGKLLTLSHSFSKQTLLNFEPASKLEEINV